MRRWLPSHLRRFPLKYKTWLASAESIDPKRDRLVESHLSRNERWATRPARAGLAVLVCLSAALGIRLALFDFRDSFCPAFAQVSKLDEIGQVEDGAVLHEPYMLIWPHLDKVERAQPAQLRSKCMASLVV